MRRRVTDYLVQEHQELSRLVNQLGGELRALPMIRSDARLENLHKLSRQVSRVFRTHLEEEEEILYPMLEARVEGISGTLEKMRHENRTGKSTEKKFLVAVERLVEKKSKREEVMQSGQDFVLWMRGHMLAENGRLFPLVERKLDAEAQVEVCRAMAQLNQESLAGISGLATQA